VTQSSKRLYYIRVELPHDATEEEREDLEKAVVDLAEQKSEEFDYDIFVSGGAWYPPEDESTHPISVAQGKLHAMIYARPLHDNPVDAALLRDALQELSDLGISQIDLQVYLERERAMNEVALRNMMAEENLLTALDMVVGNVVPLMRVKFPQYELSALRKFGPKAEEHPSVGKECPACREPFLVGDYTTLIALGPGTDSEAQERAREGRPYNAIAMEIHWGCATGGVTN
jgi:hypothetical protein